MSERALRAPRFLSTRPAYIVHSIGEIVNEPAWWKSANHSMVCWRSQAQGCRSFYTIVEKLLCPWYRHGDALTADR